MSAKTRFPKNMRTALWAVVLAAIVPLVALQVGLCAQWFAFRQADEAEHSYEFSHAIGMALGAHIDDIRRTEMALGDALAQMEPLDAAKATDILERNRQDFTTVRTMAFADPSGKILVATTPGVVGQSIAQRAYFQEVARGKEWVVSDLLLEKGTAQPTMIIARRVNDRQGRMIGVITAAVEPDSLGGVIWSVHKNEQSFYAVFDRNGTVISHTLGPSLGHPNWRDRDPVLAQALRGQEAQGIVANAPLDGKTRLLTRIPLRDLGLVVGAGKTMDDINRPIYRGIWWLAGINAAVLGLSLAGAYGVSRIVSRQVSILGEHAAKISQGDLSHRGSVKRIAELAALAETFNQMAGDLQERQNRIEDTVRELKRSNEELEQFAYVASHDLQEPLRVIGGYVQLIERRYKGRLDADADTFIAFITDAVSRQQQLIQDLLSYSRVGTRGKPFTPCDMNDVLAGAMENLGRVMEDSHAVVTHDPLPIVMGDRPQLTQLLQNLIGNAIKFKSDKPPAVHVSARRQDGLWRLTVKDNGIGIEPKYFEQIFVVFQRLHTRSEYPGTGIGLAICKKIVERHGGRIWVESRGGDGTAFHFTLRPEGESQ